MLGCSLLAPGAAAQNLDALSGYAAQGANVTLSGPYTFEGTQYWIAKIGSKDHVVTSDYRVNDSQIYETIILAEETYRRIPAGISMLLLGSKVQLGMLWMLKSLANAASGYILPWAYTTAALALKPAFLVLPGSAESVATGYLELSRNAAEFQLTAAVQTIEISGNAQRGIRMLTELKDTKDAEHARQYISNNQLIELAASSHSAYKLGKQDELALEYNQVSAEASALFGRSAQPLQQFPEPSEINIKDTALNSKQANSAIQGAVGARIAENGTV